MLLGMTLSLLDTDSMAVGLHLRYCPICLYTCILRVSMMAAKLWASCSHSVLHNTSAQASASPEGTALLCYNLRPDMQ